MPSVKRFFSLPGVEMPLITNMPLPLMTAKLVWKHSAASAKKYPEIDAKQILTDLAESGGNPGKWFAAAKDAGYLDLALDFAKLGRTDPLTLSRASRDFLKSNPAFAFHIARLAVEGILAGDGYEITRLDLVGAVEHFLAAARRIGAEANAERELTKMIASHHEASSFVRTRISWLLGEPLRLD